MRVFKKSPYIQATGTPVFGGRSKKFSLFSEHHWLSHSRCSHKHLQVRQSKEPLNKSPAAEQRIFFPIGSVWKTWNTYSIPSFFKLSAEKKSLAVSSCGFNQSFPNWCCALLQEAKACAARLGAMIKAGLRLTQASFFFVYPIIGGVFLVTCHFSDCQKTGKLQIS